jgi:hypothetical protein
MASIECFHCKASYRIEAALDQCGWSSTEASAVCFSCPACRTHHWFAVQTGRMARIDTLPVESWVAIANLEVRAFDGFVHLWYDGKHWAIADRHSLIRA